MELHATNQTGCKWKGDAESEDGEGDRHRFLRGERHEGGTWELQKRFWVSEKLADMLRSAHASALAARCVSGRVKVDERRNGGEKMGEAAAGWKLAHRGAALID